MIQGLCADCDYNYLNHSFHLLYKKDEINVFYSCPSKAIKYNDTNGIISHFNAILSYYNNNYWKCIFDFNDFELKHMLQINTAIGIAKIINIYSDYLIEIKIINTNRYTQIMLNMVIPFLNSSVKNKIVF